MILLIAPYSPAGLTHSNLGAARKLEAVVRILSTFDEDLVLINTAHNELRHCPDMLSVRNEIDGVKVTEVTLPTRASRSWGKLLNLFSTSTILRRVTAQRNIQLVWLYNGYAFESLAAAALRRDSYSGPIVLEFEDWHFARRARIGLKKMVDYAAWRFSLPAVSFAFCVNSSLRTRLSKYGIPTALLPGIIPREISALRAQRRTSTNDRHLPVVGYFGGLNAEKGAPELLKLIEGPQLRCRFLVCGGGPLAADFAALAENIGDYLRFHSGVPTAELFQLIGQCDVILNPHRVDGGLADGIFPSKVLEAIGSGRALISTALKSDQLEDALQGVTYYDGTVQGLANAISAVVESGIRPTVDLGAIAANSRFSEEAIANAVRAILTHPPARH